MTVPSRPKVLFVEDEASISGPFSKALAREGFEPVVAATAARALELADHMEPDIVLLDLMLPRVDGFSVFQSIRARAATPVIMLTARGGEAERIAGLELGADDYVAKPFSPREVVARVQAVLRRQPAQGGSSEREKLLFGDLEIDGSSREVRFEGQPAALTPKEFDLLYLMASSPRTVFTRSELLEELWDLSFQGDPSTVTVHIRRLREKIEHNPSTPAHLVTVWGVGYRFEP
jgi:DNA-binding response OmpR family regulator